MISRLKKIANHVGYRSHEDVTKNVIDNERSKRRESSDSFLTAKKLAADCPITPTQENLLIISKAIDDGKYSDLGKSKDDYRSWKNRTIEILKNAGVLI